MGPGVAWPRAMPSRNWVSVSHPRATTSGASRGTRTSPPPKRSSPVRRKTQASAGSAVGPMTAVTARGTAEAAGAPARAADEPGWEPPQGGHHGGQCDGLDARQEIVADLKASGPKVGPGQDQEHQERRQRERQAGNETAQRPRPHVAEVDGDLTRVGPGDQVGDSHDVEEMPLVDPLPPSDQVLVHGGDVGVGPAEADRAEAEEVERQLPQSAHGPEL